MSPRTTKKQPEQTKFTFQLETELLEKLQEHQAQTDVPIAAFIRRAIREALDKQSSK